MNATNVVCIAAPFMRHPSDADDPGRPSQIKAQQKPSCRILCVHNHAVEGKILIFHDLIAVVTNDHDIIRLSSAYLCMKTRNLQ